MPRTRKSVTPSMTTGAVSCSTTDSAAAARRSALWAEAESCADAPLPHTSAAQTTRNEYRRLTRMLLGPDPGSKCAAGRGNGAREPSHDEAVADAGAIEPRASRRRGSGPVARRGETPAREELRFQRGLADVDQPNTRRTFLDCVLVRSFPTPWSGPADLSICRLKD